MMPQRDYDTFTSSSLQRELFDSIKVGDYLKVNDWHRGMRVWGVSENYILASTKSFNGQWLYTIIRKIMWTGQYNKKDRNTFICGPDDCIFGVLHDHAYEFDDEDFVKFYLDKLESGSIGMSRKCVSIYRLRLWRCG